MKSEDWLIISALYKTKNLTQASKVLFMSQSALTKRLQVIESRLGYQLVHRSNKGITFTPEGEYVVHQAERFIELYEETISYLHKIDSKKKQVSVLRIASPSTFAAHILPDILETYVSENPGVEFKVLVDVSSSVSAHVEYGRVDCGFVLGDNLSSCSKVLFAQEQGFAVYHKPITYDMLPQLNLIAHNRNEITNKSILRWYKSHYKYAPPSMVMNVSTLDIALEMVARGFGYSIVFSGILHQKRSDLFFLPLNHKDGSAFSRNTWFLYDEGALDLDIFKNFSDLVIRLSKSEVNGRNY